MYTRHLEVENNVNGFCGDLEYETLHKGEKCEMARSAEKF